MTSLTIPEEEFHELLVKGEIQLHPPLNDESIEKMRYNRNREFYYPEMEFLDDEEAVQKYRTYAEAALSAQSRLRKLSFSQKPAGEQEDEIDKQISIIRTSSIRMFSLLKPLLRYHEFWRELEYDNITGEGLKQLEEFEDNPSKLPVDDAFTAVQEMRTASHTFGLLYDNQEQIVDTMEQVDYWMEELEAESGADFDTRE